MAGWFEEQIEYRIRSDAEAFEDAMQRIAGSVLGQRLSAFLLSERERTTDAVTAILQFFRVKPGDVPDHLNDMDEVLAFLLQPSGIMTREVKLTPHWHKDASGPMLTTFSSDAQPVALIPNGFGGYRYADPVSGEMRRVGAKEERLFSQEAIAFYKPLPAKKLNRRDVFAFLFENLDQGSISLLLIFGFAASLVGLLLPWLHRQLFSDVLFSESVQVIVAIAVFMICVSVSQMLFKISRDLVLKRISLKLNQSLQSAVMLRILSLPTSFFKDFSSGDLAERTSYMGLLVRCLFEITISAWLTVLFSVIYVLQIISLAPALTLPALMTALLMLFFILLSIVLRSDNFRAQMDYAAKEDGLAYALISGIEKIRLSGAEQRAFARWGRAYATQAKYLYDPPLYLKVSDVILQSIPLIASVAIYSVSIHADISVSQYYAFNAAFAVLVAALLELSAAVPAAALINPIFAMSKPFLEAVPETSEEKPVIEQLSGSVELSNVTFRYREDMPPILNNLSLKIKAGQFIAIVGKTGCGKSTLMRILLGFETPQKGAVYYDGKDIRSVDIKSLRSRIGTVLQNGKLFAGDIYSNIVITDPRLTLDDAWEASEMAGMADDIRAMPMGMHTFIAEGSGGISGGQRQRLLIARAIAPKPKILMFDEATSALDNITQKKVSDALAGLNCTRIVIAHRLSTIRHCDRIIVLEGGSIIEDGTYEELMHLNGAFAELVKRQKVDRLS